MDPRANLLAAIRARGETPAVAPPSLKKNEAKPSELDKSKKRPEQTKQHENQNQATRPVLKFPFYNSQSKILKSKASESSESKTPASKTSIFKSAKPSPAGTQVGKTSAPPPLKFNATDLQAEIRKRSEAKNSQTNTTTSTPSFSKTGTPINKNEPSTIQRQSSAKPSSSGFSTSDLHAAIKKRAETKITPSNPPPQQQSLKTTAPPLSFAAAIAAAANARKDGLVTSESKQQNTSENQTLNRDSQSSSNNSAPSKLANMGIDNAAKSTAPNSHPSNVVTGRDKDTTATVSALSQPRPTPPIATPKDTSSLTIKTQEQNDKHEYANPSRTNSNSRVTLLKKPNDFPQLIKPNNNSKIETTDAAAKTKLALEKIKSNAHNEAIGKRDEVPTGTKKSQTDKKDLHHQQRLREHSMARGRGFKDSKSQHKASSDETSYKDESLDRASPAAVRKATGTNKRHATAAEKILSDYANKYAPEDSKPATTPSINNKPPSPYCYSSAVRKNDKYSSPPRLVSEVERRRRRSSISNRIEKGKRSSSQIFDYSDDKPTPVASSAKRKEEQQQQQCNGSTNNTSSNRRHSMSNFVRITEDATAVTGNESPSSQLKNQQDEKSNNVKAPEAQVKIEAALNNLTHDEKSPKYQQKKNFPISQNRYTSIQMSHNNNPSSDKPFRLPTKNITSNVTASAARARVPVLNLQNYRTLTDPKDVQKAWNSLSSRFMEP